MFRDFGPQGGVPKRRLQTLVRGLGPQHLGPHGASANPAGPKPQLTAFKDLSLDTNADKVRFAAFIVLFHFLFYAEGHLQFGLRIKIILAHD